MKKVTYFLIAFVYSILSNAQEIPSGGNNIIAEEKLKFIKLNKEFGQVVFENGSLIATTTKQPENVYNLGIRIPLKDVQISENQPFLLCFEAKTIEASLETAEAKVNWLFKQVESSAPKDVVSKSVSISTNWQSYFIPFKTNQPIDKNYLSLAMQFGYPKQKFEIKNIRLIAYPTTFDIKKLPSTKLTYVGMEENATWRIEAEKRIEQIRKGNFTLKFDKNGNAISNVDVKISLVKHKFPFGAALDAEKILNDTSYYETFKNLFSIAVFENDLKMKRWQNQKKRVLTLQAIDRLNNDNIKVKGHVLLWPSFKYLAENVELNKDNPEKVKSILDNHVKSILNGTKGKIAHWDVLNEIYTNNEIQNVLKSDDILFETFLKAKEIDPKAERFINEYGIESGGGFNTTKQDWYFNFIKEIDKKTKGAIDGFGFQSHIGTDMTPPARIVEILNRFAQLNKKISISEFTLDVEDPEIKAKYTNDYMIAAFSNPAVSEFLFWGFFEPDNPKAGLVDKDYNLTKMGLAYYNLVFGKWKTTINKKSSTTGEISERGFYGTYKYEIIVEGKPYIGTFELEKGNSKPIIIKLK